MIRLFEWSQRTKWSHHSFFFLFQKIEIREPVIIEKMADIDSLSAANFLTML